MTETRGRAPLRRGDLNPDPVAQFILWLQEAEQAEAEPPIAVTLATADRAGRPAARIVLLRGVDERGLVFFTNYQSRKGSDLQENPRAALLFYWPRQSRQVRIEGRVGKLATRESDAYFAGRPRGHQLQAHASPQSRPIPGRAFLVERFAEIAQKFAERPVTRPRHWGGYRVVPEVVEFWQEGENRLHDRLRYGRGADGAWVIERLAP